MTDPSELPGLVAALAIAVDKVLAEDVVDPFPWPAANVFITDELLERAARTQVFAERDERRSGWVIKVRP